MITLLADLSNADAGEILGYAIAVMLSGGSVYAWHRYSHSSPSASPYATKDELHRLEHKHDKFEEEIRATLRDSEQRTHKRLDVLSSKMDESIGLQKGNSQVIHSMLEHLIRPTHHDHQS